MKVPTRLKGKTSRHREAKCTQSISLWLKFLKSLFWEGVAWMKVRFITIKLFYFHPRIIKIIEKI